MTFLVKMEQFSGILQNDEIYQISAIFSILDEILNFSDFHDFSPSGRLRRRPRPPRPPPAAAASAAAEAEDFRTFSPPGGRRGGARAASNLPLASLLSPQVGYFI